MGSVYKVFQQASLLELKHLEIRLQNEQNGGSWPLPRAPTTSCLEPVLIIMYTIVIRIPDAQHNTAKDRISLQAGYRGLYLLDVGINLRESVHQIMLMWVVLQILDPLLRHLVFRGTKMGPSFWELPMRVLSPKTPTSLEKNHKTPSSSLKT